MRVPSPLVRWATTFSVAITLLFLQVLVGLPGADAGTPVNSSDGYVTLTVTASTSSVQSSGTDVQWTYSIRNKGATPVYWQYGASTATLTAGCTPSAPTAGSGNWLSNANGIYIAAGTIASLTCTQKVSSTTTNTVNLTGMRTGSSGGTPVQAVSAQETVYEAFDCNAPTIYLNQGGPSLLKQAELTNGNTGFSDKNSSTFQYNSLAYNKATNLMYAITQSPSTADQLLVIDKAGATYNLGTVTGFDPADSGQLNAGFFDDSGNYWVSSSNGGTTGKLYKIDLSTRVATSISNQTTLVKANDLTYSSGYAWGINTQSSASNTVTVVRIQLSNGAMVTKTITLPAPPPPVPAVTPVPTTWGTTWGGAWSYGNGDIGFLNNSGGYVQLRVTGVTPTSFTPTLVHTFSAAGSSNNDAAMCSRPTNLSIAKTATTVVGPTQTVTWTMTVTNNGPYPSSGYTVTDVIPQGFSDPKVVAANTTIAGCQITNDGTPNPTYPTYTLTCYGDQLGVSQTASVTLTAKAPSAEGLYSNTGKVEGNEGGSNTSTPASSQVKNPTITLVKSIVGGRANSSDQFTVQLKDNAPKVVASVTTPLVALKPDTTSSSSFSGTAGSSYTLAEIAISGNVSNYAQSAACYDSSGYTSGLGNSSNPTTITLDTGTITPAAGATITCTVTNALKPTIKVTKSITGGGRFVNAHQFTVSIWDSTPTKVTTGTTTAGSGKDITTGTGGTAAIAVTADAAYTIAELGSGGADVSAYTQTATCYDSTGNTAGMSSDQSKPTVVAPSTLNTDGTFKTAGTSIKPAAGAVISCTITNATPIPVIKVAKLSDSVCPGGDCSIAGAQFSLYTSDPTSGTATPLANGITADTGGKTFTSGALNYDTTYWLLETKAPSNHNLMPTPVKFTIGSKGISLSIPVPPSSVVKVTGTSSDTIQVTDSASGTLPATGGRGATPFVGVAALLLLAAAGLYRQGPVSQRVRRQHQSGEARS